MIINAKKHEVVEVGTGTCVETVYAPLMTNEIMALIQERNAGKELYIRKCDKTKKIYEVKEDKE